jgi:hypothetical protein
VRQAILDTATVQFPAEVTKLAQSMIAQGDPVYGASCVRVGKGSMKWSEEELKALEIGVVVITTSAQDGSAASERITAAPTCPVPPMIKTRNAILGPSITVVFLL